MFGCSEERDMAGGVMKGPKLEPLPDWDSLPPIEEGMAAEEGSTMMEKAEEKVEDDSWKSSYIAEGKA